MDKAITPSKLIDEEMAQTEQSLTTIGKFGVMMVALALIAFVLLLYKLGTLVSPLDLAGQKLVVACIALILMVILAGYKFTEVANYKQAIYSWREQSMKEYIERQKK
jgi:hypothetical protein